MTPSDVWAILAPGPSLTAQQCERVRHLNTIAVNNAYQLAPWAEHLVANDRSWWRRNPEAMNFAGGKHSAVEVPHVQRVEPRSYATESSSGVLALDLARNLGAKRVILLGCDMHGSHFFGPYTNGLTNTPQSRRLVHQQQFKQWARQNKGVHVVNCTPGSKLEAFPMASLDESLPEPAAP